MTNRETTDRLVKRAKELGWDVRRIFESPGQKSAHYWFQIYTPGGYMEIFGCEEGEDGCVKGLFFQGIRDRKACFRELTGKDDPSIIRGCTTISFSVLNGMMWTTEEST